MILKTNTVLANLQDALAQKKPFVFYRKSNSNLVYQIIQENNNLVFLNNFNEQGFIFAPFDNKLDTVIFPFKISSFSKTLFYINNNLTRSTAQTSDNNNLKHQKLVAKGIDFITNNQTPKIVLSRKETIVKENFNTIKTFENLLNKYNNAFVYIWFHPKVGLWLGATPETLLQTKNNNFKTMSLAGTQRYKDTLEATWQNKEKEEHQHVTTFIKNELKSMNIDCFISKTKTIKAGNLLHLQANISGKLNTKTDLGKIINTLHPTPAVCGVPKNKAKQFILKNEQYNRAFYTGYLGELNIETDNQRSNNKRNIENHAYQFNQTQTNLFVNLRCMQIQSNKINIYVGGGITKDSNPEKEYLETVAKAEVMKSVIA